MKELIEMLEDLEREPENIDIYEMDEIDEDKISFSGRLDHPMSGYGGSFEACDFEITITRKSDSEFEVKIETERFGGSLPGYYQRQLDSCSMDWEDVFEDYDDLRSGDCEKDSYSQTFSTFKDAMEYADNEYQFEG